jgi:replication factor A1
VKKMVELMKVSQLRPRMGNVFIELEVVSKGEIREFASAKGSGKVCSAAGKDDTGEVQVSLWNEQIDQVNEGQKIRIENGWVSEYKGQLQLSTGKFGTLHVLE